MGHLLTENRNGLIVEAEVSEVGTRQEWDTGRTMLASQGTRPGMTVGADRGYDTGEFVDGCRGLSITHHVAQKPVRSAIDGRTTNTWGYRISQLKRKRIEECFGLMRKLRHVGREKTAWIFWFKAASGLQYYEIERVVGLKLRENDPHVGNFCDMSIK